MCMMCCQFFFPQYTQTISPQSTKKSEMIYLLLIKKVTNDNSTQGAVICQIMTRFVKIQYEMDN